MSAESIRLLWKRVGVDGEDGFHVVDWRVEGSSVDDECTVDGGVNWNNLAGTDDGVHVHCC